MTFPTLASDFSCFEALLADHEKEQLVRLRSFLESEVKPVVKDYWDRAEFPRQILPGLHEQQVFGNLWDETKAGDYSAVYGGWTAFDMARVDASIATYVGVQTTTPRRRGAACPRCAAARRGLSVRACHGIGSPAGVPTVADTVSARHKTSARTSLGRSGTHPSRRT